MKVAVFGSRGIRKINMAEYLPQNTDMIVSGGAIGVDRIAARYARVRNIKLVEFLPDYDLFGKRAPVIRDKRIADYADEGIAFWDGKSKGTLYTIDFLKEKGKNVTVYIHI